MELETNPKFRQLDREFGDSPEFLKETENKHKWLGTTEAVELEELVRAQNAAINEMRQITESLRYFRKFPDDSTSNAESRI